MTAELAGHPIVDVLSLSETWKDGHRRVRVTLDLDPGDAPIEAVDPALHELELAGDVAAAAAKVEEAKAAGVREADLEAAKAGAAKAELAPPPLPQPEPDRLAARSTGRAEEA